MMPAYLRVRIMGVGMNAVKHEYFQLIIQMCFYFFTAALALYFSALHNARKAVNSLATEPNADPE
jgi:ABC-2 type transport system permease protein